MCKKIKNIHNYFVPFTNRLLVPLLCISPFFLKPSYFSMPNCSVDAFHCYPRKKEKKGQKERERERGGGGEEE